MSGPDEEMLHLPLAARRIRRRELRIEPDDWHALAEAQWRGSLVLLEHGDVELHCVRGGSRLFRQGAVLCFDGTGVRALHNPGTVTTVLAGYSRIRAHGMGCGDGVHPA